MPPGKEGKITLAVEHTEGYVGEVVKSAAVSTNDPAQPTFSLMLRAHFKPEQKPGAPPSPLAMAAAGKPSGPFGVQPTDRWVTGVLSGATATSTLYLMNLEPTPVHIKEVVPGGDNFTVRVQPIENGKRYELLVATNPALKPGHYEQTVRILTDSKTSPESRVVLEANVHPRVFVSPTAIILPALNAETDVGTILLPSISVRKMRDSGLKINNATSSLPFIKLEIAPEVEGQFFKIHLTIDKARIPGPGEYRGKIRIETNDADSPFFEVPIQGSFK